MGKYLGIVEIKGSYYNFKPMARIRSKDKGYEILEDEDRKEILPESGRMNINLSYKSSDNSQYTEISRHFRNCPVVSFEFELGDLEKNLTTDGRLNLTGYKVVYRTVFQNGKLGSINTLGYYLVLPLESIRSDFEHDSVVLLEQGPYAVGDRIFVAWRPGYYAGPYEVGYRELDDSYFIKPNIKNNKYIVSCYTSEACTLENFGDYPDRFTPAKPNTENTLLRINRGATKTQVDVITDEELLKSFEGSLGYSGIKDGKIDLNETSALLETYRQVILAGGSLSENIKKDRMERLTRILSTIGEEYSVVQNMTSMIATIFADYQNNPQVARLLESVFEEHPDLIDKLKGTQSVRTRIDRLQTEVQTLQDQKEELSKDLEIKRTSKAEEEQRYVSQRLSKEIALKEKALSEITEKLELSDSLVDMRKQQEILRKDVESQERHKQELENDTRRLESAFNEQLDHYHDRMVGIAFDGFISNKMFSAAAQWEAETEELSYDAVIEKTEQACFDGIEDKDVVDYLCRIIQTERPKYSKNTIINILVCVSQSFLTVFSGEPGGGKTSICRIIADAIGLTSVSRELGEIGGIETDRYVPVSVERGWTSKRDLVGYYNPLTKTFDKSNKRMFDALKVLDLEQKKGYAKYPYMILLDEANLSPMEYYWADFMNICDDLDENSSINLGNEYCFHIPETLRFVATINNDHTTEILSPRLIDRAWVITLPKNVNVMDGGKIDRDQIRILPWDQIRRIFMESPDQDYEISAEAQKLYEDLKLICRKQKLSVSPRTEMAIRRYWSVASKIMEKDEYENDPSIVALDYAVAQKILPRILGNGVTYESWLNELKSYCSSNSLNISEGILTDIIERGNLQMKYYQFFY